jgi:hypothetical protein
MQTETITSQILTTRFFMDKPQKYDPAKSRFSDILLLSVRGLCTVADILERSGFSARKSVSLWCLPLSSLELRRELAIFKLEYEELWPRSLNSPNLLPLEFMAVQLGDFIPPYPGSTVCPAPLQVLASGIDVSDYLKIPQSMMPTQLATQIPFILGTFRSPMFQANQTSWICFWTRLSLSVEISRLLLSFVIFRTCSVTQLLLSLIPDPSWIILSLIFALVLYLVKVSTCTQKHCLPAKYHAGLPVSHDRKKTTLYICGPVITLANSSSDIHSCYAKP